MTKHAERPLNRPRQPLYSVEEAADLLGVGRTYMFHLLATGEIDSLKIGRRRRITRDALDGYLERLRSEQAPQPYRESPGARSLARNNQLPSHP